MKPDPDPDPDPKPDPDSGPDPVYTSESLKTSKRCVSTWWRCHGNGGSIIVYFKTTTKVFHSDFLTEAPFPSEAGQFARFPTFPQTSGSGSGLTQIPAGGWGSESELLHVVSSVCR